MLHISALIAVIPVLLKYYYHISKHNTRMGSQKKAAPQIREAAIICTLPVYSVVKQLRLITGYFGPHRTAGAKTHQVINWVNIRGGGDNLVHLSCGAINVL